MTKIKWKRWQYFIALKDTTKINKKKMLEDNTYAKWTIDSDEFQKLNWS